jgi:hypothetical protein
MRLHIPQTIPGALSIATISPEHFYRFNFRPLDRLINAFELWVIERYKGRLRII